MARGQAMPQPQTSLATASPVQKDASQVTPTQKLKAQMVTGDKNARKQLTARRKERLRMRNKRANEKAQRDAGDADAIARYQRQKLIERQRYAEKHGRKVKPSAQKPGPEMQSMPVSDGALVDEMSGISDDDDSEIDDDYADSDIEDLPPTPRSPTDRSAKKNVQYNEEVDDIEMGETSLPEEIESNEQQAIVSSASRRGAAEASTQNSTTRAPEGPRAAKMTGRSEVNRQVLRVPTGATVVHLCGSEDDRKPVYTQVQQLGNRVSKAAGECVNAPIKPESGVKVQQEAIVFKDGDTTEKVVTFSQPPFDESATQSEAVSLHEQKLRLKLRKLELEKEAVEVEMELLQFQK